MIGTSLPDRQCPVCGKRGAPYAAARDIEYFTTPEVFQYYRCVDCDLIYIDPAPIDRLSVIYPANYYSFVDTDKKNVVVRFKEWLDKRAFQKFLKEIRGDSLSVLDVGGGSGWLAKLLRDIDPRVRSTQIVDIDAGAQKLAESHGHKFFCGVIEDFASEDRYDAILMLNLIEHVEDPVAVLKKANALLAPGGRIYVKTPNFRALDARLFKDRNWGGYHCPRHFVLFSRESFSSAAAKAGLAVAEFSYTQGAPFWSVSILEMLRRWGLASVTAARPAIYHPLMPLLQAAGAAFDFARAPFARLSQMVVVLAKAD
ncbi:MAG TPA: class I SAM-dependent methyltransferase [Roseiarcus sp.]|nr:class I SAM-dependent methyltransferase [Roseiarcus sp.]